MPSYIVRPVSATIDGSFMNSQVMVTAANEHEAKVSGAEQLGVSVSHVTATLYGNPHWDEYR